MTSSTTRRSLAILAALPAVLLAAAPASAQTAADRWMARCEEQGSGNRGEHHCEVRTYELASTGSLEVDAAPNGGITVTEGSGNRVEVVAMVRANARSRADAEALAREVRVIAEPGAIRTDGPRPGRGAGWSVSYEIRVPRQTDLALESTNGGISVADVSGAHRLRTTNGGISLDRVSGDVRGRTVNGGITATLAGDRWNGAGLELTTTNGGVRLNVPDGYSAELRASTVNGGIDVEFPITVQGRIGRRVEASLGRGGAPIRVQTTNGGVTLSRQ